MGIAAYNRGTRAIRQQFDAEAKSREHFNDLQHFRSLAANHQVTIDVLNARLERAARAFRALELSRTIEREQAAERLESERKVTAIYRDMVLSGHTQAKGAGKLIWWLKGLLTFSGVTIEQRDAYEAELAQDGEAYRLGPFADTTEVVR